MGDLPELDPQAVINRLAQRNAELQTQIASLEVLCEALRDERDRARAAQGPV